MGYFAQLGLAWLMRDMIGHTLPMPGFQPAVLGLVTALSILAGFALPDLAQMGRTPPLRVLRQDLDPPSLRYGASWLAGVAAIMALLLWIMRDTRLVLTIFAGATATFLALGATGWIMVRSLRGFRGAAGVAWRYGLANIARRGRESVVQVVAFGLGLMVLLLLSTVRTELMETWRQSLPDNAPNQFLINIQPHEVEGMGAFFASRDLGAPRFVPMVRARMATINGESVTQMTFEDPQGERWARRDSNLSWAADLQEDNKIIEGEFWDGTPAQPEVSVEEEFGRELGLSLGDELGFNVAGEDVTATVTSFRTVEWDTFSPNFFMVFSPGVLEPYPATYISSLYVEEHQRGAVLEMMRQFPSVTAIRFWPVSRSCGPRCRRHVTSGGTKAPCCAPLARRKTAFSEEWPWSSSPSACLRAFWPPPEQRWAATCWPKTCSTSNTVSASSCGWRDPWQVYC
jgi:putative ABC transport system permease protein